MGLGLTVGILADLNVNDPEGADWVREQLQDVNAALMAAGLPGHNEPSDCEVWFADGYGYSGLHALREVAGLVYQGRSVPRAPLIDGRDTPAADKHFDTSLAALTPRKRSVLDKVLGREPEPVPPFIHLAVHSDAEGYYVPIDFTVPIVPATMRQETASIWPVGSVQRLADELGQLAAALEIPDDLQSDGDDMTHALDSLQPDPTGPLWQAQPIAAYSALILREACAVSMRTGAAIAFG